MLSHPGKSAALTVRLGTTSATGASTGSTGTSGAYTDSPTSTFRPDTRHHSPSAIPPTLPTRRGAVTRFAHHGSGLCRETVRPDPWPVRSRAVIWVG
ncbi:hypothetical protein KCMC57_up28930 [Kitasatospora sp. CMC57]|uniref:Uncharacterized protein n=1 Tax=Kitasatospora sp. CMC57 TaxID=3231513 RepID=A0AB33K3Q3_9ACTN